MRSALQPLVTDLQTDQSTHQCSFIVNLDELDISARLNEFSRTNSHIRGWKLLAQEPAQQPAAEASDSDEAPVSDKPESDTTDSDKESTPP